MADDESGIYLRSRGLASGGETPGAGIFLNPQGGLDVPSFSDWFSGLAAPDQGAISAAIANLGTPGAAPAGTDPAATPAADPNAVPNAVFGTPASDPSTLPAFFSPDGSTAGANLTGQNTGGLPATVTPTIPAGSAAATPASNLPGVPGNPLNNPVVNEVAQNFTGTPAAGIPPGATPQLGNNPPATPQPTAPNAAMTPDMQAYVLSRMNLSQPALGGIGGGA